MQTVRGSALSAICQPTLSAHSPRLMWDLHRFPIVLRKRKDDRALVSRAVDGEMELRDEGLLTQVLYQRSAPALRIFSLVL